MDTTSSIALALGVLLNHRRSSIRACVLAILLPLSLVEFVVLGFAFPFLVVISSAGFSCAMAPPSC